MKKRILHHNESQSNSCKESNARDSMLKESEAFFATFFQAATHKNICKPSQLGPALNVSRLLMQESKKHKINHGSALGLGVHVEKERNERERERAGQAGYDMCMTSK